MRPCPSGAAGRDPGLAATLALGRELVGDAREHGVAVAAIGAGLPEYVGADGRVRSHEVLAWDEQPAALLRSLVPGARCVVDADVRCGALAEACLGAGRGYASVLYVSVGTGLSSALVLDGLPLRGTRGEAIALGELDAPDGAGRLEPRCSGGGIAQRYAARTGCLLRSAGEVAPDVEAPLGGAREVGGRLDGAREVEARARGGDSVAAAVLEDAGRALGLALGAIVGLLDPGVVVLGGGLGSAPGTAFGSALATAYRARASERPDPPPLATASLGARSGVIGAALAALLGDERRLPH